MLDTKEKFEEYIFENIKSTGMQNKILNSVDWDKKSIKKGWFKYAVLPAGFRIPDCIEIFEEGAFQEAIFEGELILPNKLLKIDDYSFTMAEFSFPLTFPAGLEYIGYKSFKGCFGLVFDFFPANIKHIDEDAFFDISISPFTYASIANCNVFKSNIDEYICGVKKNELEELNLFAKYLNAIEFVEIYKAFKIFKDLYDEKTTEIYAEINKNIISLMIHEHNNNIESGSSISDLSLAQTHELLSHFKIGEVCGMISFSESIVLFAKKISNFINTKNKINLESAIIKFKEMSFGLLYAGQLKFKIAASDEFVEFYAFSDLTKRNLLTVGICKKLNLQ